MGQALRKNVYQGSHDFLPFGRQRHLRLVPRMHQKSARIKVRHASSIGLEYTLDSDFNKLLARYTHSPLAPDDVLAADITADGVTAQLAQNAGTAVFIKDAQGTVTDVTDSAGSKIMHYVYGAFGELIGVRDAYGADVSAAPPVNTSYGFTGREKDSESNMLYYRARYYVPEIGRFLQKDPEPGRLLLPLAVINAYIYVSNNSQNLTDPKGELWFLVAILAFGALQAGLNIREAQQQGVHDFGKLLGIGLTGFATGALSAAVSFTNPMLGIFVGAGLAGVNNAINQGIVYGFNNINWQRVQWSVGDTAMGGLVGYGVGQAIAPFILQTTAGQKFITGISTAGSMGWTINTDTGIAPCSGYDSTGQKICTSVQPRQVQPSN